MAEYPCMCTPEYQAMLDLPENAEFKRETYIACSDPLGVRPLHERGDPKYSPVNIVERRYTSWRVDENCDRQGSDLFNARDNYYSELEKHFEDFTDLDDSNAYLKQRRELFRKRKTSVRESENDDPEFNWHSSLRGLNPWYGDSRGGLGECRETFGVSRGGLDDTGGDGRVAQRWDRRYDVNNRGNGTGYERSPRSSLYERVSALNRAKKRIVRSSITPINIDCVSDKSDDRRRQSSDGSGEVAKSDSSITFDYTDSCLKDDLDMSNQLYDVDFDTDFDNLKLVVYNGDADSGAGVTSDFYDTLVDATEPGQLSPTAMHYYDEAFRCRTDFRSKYEKDDIL